METEKNQNVNEFVDEKMLLLKKAIKLSTTITINTFILNMLLFAKYASSTTKPFYDNLIIFQTIFLSVTVIAQFITIKKLLKEVKK